MGIPAGAKAAPRGGRLRTPYSLTASASDAQGRASKNPHGATGFPRTAAFFSKNSQIERLSDKLLLGVASKNPPRNRGQIKRLPDALLLEASGLVEALGISRDVPAKTLTEQGAAAHMSKLLDVVTTLTDRRAARRVAAGRCRGSWRCQGYPDMCQQKPSQNKRLPRTCPSFWML